MAYDGTLKFDTSIDTSGFSDGIEKIGSAASTALKATSAIVTGAATAIVGIGTAATKVGMDFEASMSNVAAISGATGNELQALTAKAQEMGAKTKFSASESADAFSYMAMAGWKTVDMLDGIEGIMNLAAASGEDLATVSDIVTDALTAMGLQASDSAHFADVLAAASSNSNTNVAMMGETFKYAAPLAGALGYNIEDLAQAIGLMANSGIKGGQAGTSLRSILTRLADPPKDCAAAMEEYGISLTNADGSMKSLMQVMENMRDSLGGLSEKEQASAASAIGGQEAMSGLLAIVNASEGDFDKLASAIDNATDSLDGSKSAAASMAATMNDNLQGQVTILQSALEGLGISFYENMQTPMKDVVAEANSMVGELQQAFNSGGFDGLVSAVGGVLSEVVQDVAEAGPQLIDAAASLVASFCDGLQNAQDIGDAGGKLITSLVTALLSCAADIWSTAITLITELATGLADGAPDVMDAAVNCVQSVVQSIIDNAPTLMQAGVQLIQNLTQGIQDNLPDLIPLAMQALMDFSGSLRENVGLIVDAGLQLITALAQSLIDNIPTFIETVPTIITNLAGIINDNAPKLLETGISLIAQLALGLVQAIPTLIENIPQIIEAVVAVFTAYNWIDLGKNIIKLLGDGITAMASAAKTAGEGIYTTVKDAIAKLPETLLNLGKDAIQHLSSGITTMVTDAQLAGVSVFEVIRAAIAQLPGALLNLGKNAISGLLNVIRNSVGNMGSAAKSVLTSIVDNIKSLPSKLLELGRNAVQSLAGAFKSLDWGSIGSNIINGIIGGIGSAIGGLVETAANAAKSAFDAAKNALGIHSPSRLFRDKIGKMIPPGIGEGIEGAMPALEKSTAAEMEALAQKMQATVSAETGRIEIEKTVSQNYKVEQEKPPKFDPSPVNVQLGGEIHTHVELDGKEVGDATTPIVDRNFGRIDKHKKRGG